MFVNETLNNHLNTSSSIKSQAAIVAEWNMNLLENIDVIGNYRNRPLDGNTSKYGAIPNSFDSSDTGYYYTNATDADTTIDAGYDDLEIPGKLIARKDKEKLLYSLEDCFKRFRPRSGINKARYGVGNEYLPHSNPDWCIRPRYYMPDKNDYFKYWTSYRTAAEYQYNYDNGVVSYGDSPTFTDNGTVKTGTSIGHKDRGIATRVSGIQNYIDDAAPFVVYKNPVPTNRIVVKMQTHVGSKNLGTFSSSAGTFSDPFFGNENKVAPSNWKIQYLQNNNWIDAVSFDRFSFREDGTDIVGSDGYVEIFYGLKVPDRYLNKFVDLGQVASDTLLPQSNFDGAAYLVKPSPDSIGKYYIWFNSAYETFTPNYDWQLYDESISGIDGLAKKLVEPDSYLSPDLITEYTEFKYISGIRVVVDTMTKQGSTFDLIELSPRLAADISDMTTQYSIAKSASDLGISGLPVAQLLAATGKLSLFDSEDAFNINNPNSVIAPYSTKNLQLKIFEKIYVSDEEFYYVPVKTMYAEEFPESNRNERMIDINIRDLYFYLESIEAPEILIPNVSLSYAVALLLDSAGFTNYSFKRLDGEADPIIPFFFVSPDKSLAEILQELAVSTQTTMFFDEYNNFVMMSKNYVLPSDSQRETDFVFYGTQDFQDSGVLENQATSINLANIIEVSSQEQSVYNDGKISYTTRYIQKTQGSIRQVYMLDKDKQWIYRPALLWEVTGGESTKSVNEQTSTQSAYALTAIPLNSDLSGALPTVVNHEVIDNIIDLGEAVYWMGRYNGYFYANAEIIKFDAIEYSIPGIADAVWITGLQEYQNYFAQIPFNGKMYPTGRVRIYSEPNYEIVNDVTRLANGPVAKHGRGQFGTTVSSHSAGLNQYWQSPNTVHGCNMQSSLLFGNSDTSSPPTITGNTGQSILGLQSNEKARRSIRTGLMKNYLGSSYNAETDININLSTDSDVVQSSALIMEGPTFTTEESPSDFVSYVYKSLSNASNVYKHFGTRMRVVGKVESSEDTWQSASGAMTYYDLQTTDPNTNKIISGGSGGVALVNAATNLGYYFELAALSVSNVDDYTDADNVANIFFYRLDGSGNSSDEKAKPKLLWSGLSQILVDTGQFTGQSRVFAQENQTVYDISFEYEEVGSQLNFYLYINGTQVATVVDDSKAYISEGNKIYNKLDSIALFVRGSSKCMFENLYALSYNYGQNTGASLNLPSSAVFSSKDVTINDSFNKYAISGIVQNTYLSGVSPAEPPKYSLYYDEFGTIMREAAYFSVRYDKAYPSLYSKIAPVLNKIKGYVVSGYFGGAYAAEFLIFNATDTVVRLDEESGNYLKIQGITFTQNSTNDLTVDDYYNKISDFSNPQYSSEGSLVFSALKEKKNYTDIKISRSTYGKKDFTIDAPYIQDYDTAFDMMGWLSEKIMRPRISIGLSIFANPTLQLGDVVEIVYSKDGQNQIAEGGKRFVVYHIEYARNLDGPSMTVYVSEV
jgi:hypothetical protein